MDALEGLKQLPDESVDLVVTDPPYNIGIDYGNGRKADKLPRDEYIKWSVRWMKECERVLKPRGSMYVINYPENNARIARAFEAKTKMIWQSWLVWHYPTNTGHSPKNWTRSHRSILFYTKSHIFTFNLKQGEIVPDFIQLNLVKNTSREKVLGFPNQIPERLVQLLIELSSRPGELVLDPFMGSGTTAKVAERMGRKWLGFESSFRNAVTSRKRI